MSIVLKDNFNSINYFPNIYIKFDSRITYAKKEKDIIGNALEINLNDYRNPNRYPNNTFFSFLKMERKKLLKMKMI